MARRSDNEGRRFSAREARAVLWLLPVLAVASWLFYEVSRTKPETGTSNFGQSGAYVALTADRGGRDSTNSTVMPTRQESATDAPLSPKLFAFDPNTVSYHELVRLGFSRGEALGIIKYRERGKVFEIPEDFAACYQVTEAMYIRLEPYIRIGEQFRLKKWKVESGKLKESPTETRKSSYDGGAEKADDSTGYDAGSARADAKKSLSTLIDLNTADSTALRSVAGIGERTVGAIMEYRARLGGFAAVEQLAEVRGVTEQNYERMITQIWLDPAVVQKININFAPAKTLATHPYMRAEALRKLLKQRQLKGGWRSITELETDDIFTQDELTRLGPYLDFN